MMSRVRERMFQRLFGEPMALFHLADCLGFQGTKRRIRQSKGLAAPSECTTQHTCMNISAQENAVCTFVMMGRAHVTKKQSYILITCLHSVVHFKGEFFARWPLLNSSRRAST